MVAAAGGDVQAEFRFSGLVLQSHLGRKAILIAGIRLDISLDAGVPIRFRRCVYAHMLDAILVSMLVAPCREIIPSGQLAPLGDASFIGGVETMHIEDHADTSSPFDSRFGTSHPHPSRFDPLNRGI